MKIFALVGFAMLSLFTGLGGNEMNRYFPDISGWAKNGDPAVYGPENLYEYIDGAAENFLNYDFRELAMLTYQDEQKHELTVEIYRHPTPETAFGIYSSEKPLKGDYFPVGTQGYYEEGLFNFYFGAFYVKMSAFDLASRDKSVFLEVGEKIAARMGPQPGAPAALDFFPPDGRIANSERFILKNFLGHPFLHSGFIADYEKQGQKFQVFLIFAADENEARTMEQKFLAAATQHPPPPISGKPFEFTDPYNGKISLVRHALSLAGAINAPAADAALYLEKIKNRLKTVRAAGK